MSNLTIDNGNSSSKIALFRNEQLVLREVWKRSSVERYKEFIDEHQVKKVILSTVGKMDPSIEDYLEQQEYFISLSYKTPLPIKNRYATPETLGDDRIAAVMGAYQLYPNEHNLVIDVGTCINIEFLTKDKEYLGGTITPGIRLRYKAMHEFTAALPLVKRRDLESFIGNSTETCMRTGAQLGALYEIEGCIQRYQDKFGKINIIITGGDAEYFVSQMKSEIFAVPNLVLIGLNKILDYNASKL